MKKLLKRVFFALLLPPLARVISPITQSQLASEWWQLRTESAFKIPGTPPNFGYKIHLKWGHPATSIEWFRML
jgi:hypothetical protein